MHIETKFSNGDKVYYATTRDESIQEPCVAGCQSGRLRIEGRLMTVACPDCGGYGYRRCAKAAPYARLLTIGQVRVEVADSPGADDHWGGSIYSYSGGSGETNYSPKHWHKESYMCVETGIGSGNIYPVEDLFRTEPEALERATWKLVEWKKRQAEDNERREKERQRIAAQYESAEETTV